MWTKVYTCGFYTATKQNCLVILISEMTKLCVDDHPENNLVHEGLYSDAYGSIFYVL